MPITLYDQVQGYAISGRSGGCCSGFRRLSIMFILLKNCVGILWEPIIRQTPAEDESNAKVIRNEPARVKEKTDQGTVAYS